MTLVGPVPFIAPPFTPGGPRSVWDPSDSYFAAGQVIPLWHSTSLTAPSVTLNANPTTPVTVGAGAVTIDHGPQWRLQEGDCIVVIAVDTASGAACTLTGTSGTQMEGATAGVYGSSFAGTSSNTDTPVVSSTAPEFVSVWSTLVKSPTAVGGNGLIVQPAYAGSAGTRRTFCYCIRPKHGFTIPNRGYRLVANGNTSGAGGAATTEAVTVTWTGGNLRTVTGVGMIVVGAATGGSSAMQVDADTDGTKEITADDSIITSTFLASGSYVGGDPHRPGTTVTVFYPSNPSSHVTQVLVYATQPDAYAARLGSGVALTMKAVPKGGRNTAPQTNLRSGAALKMKAWPRSKYSPGANRFSGVAISMKAAPRFVKHASATAGMAIDAVASPFKPSPLNRPDLAIPPGLFTAPSQRIFDIRPTERQGAIFVSDADSAVATDAVATIALADADAGTGTDASTKISLASADTAAATEGVAIAAAVHDADTGTGADVGSLGGSQAISSGDTGTATDAVVSIKLTAADTATATDAASIAATLSSADSAIAVDAVTGIRLAAADLAAAADAAAGIRLDAAETGTATEGEHVSTGGGGPSTDTGFFPFFG